MQQEEKENCLALKKCTHKLPKFFESDQTLMQYSLEESSA